MVVSSSLISSTLLPTLNNSKFLNSTLMATANQQHKHMNRQKIPPESCWGFFHNSKLLEGSWYWSCSSWGLLKRWGSVAESYRFVKENSHNDGAVAPAGNVLYSGDGAVSHESSASLSFILRWGQHENHGANKNYSEHGGANVSPVRSLQIQSWISKMQF